MMKMSLFRYNIIRLLATLWLLFKFIFTGGNENNFIIIVNDSTFIKMTGLHLMAGHIASPLLLGNRRTNIM